MSRLNDMARISQHNSTEMWLQATIVPEVEKKQKGRIFTVTLFAFIVIFLLLTLLAGVRVYSTVNDSREVSDENRMGLSLLANSVKLNDTAGAIGVGEGPEGSSLVLTERLESGNYETRIYKYNGMIVEEYSVAENAYTPERSREIVQSERFEFEYNEGLLTIYTDQGEINVALHSAGGNS